MKLFKIMRKTAEVNNDNVSGMLKFEGEVIDIDNFEYEPMPIFIKEAATIE